jgi:ankyrin repeat protein
MEASEGFFEAIKSGDQAKVQALLDIDPALLRAKSENGLSPVLTALYYQEPDIADLLIARGAELNIFEAAAAGRLDRLQALVERQAGLVNEYAEDGFQPLGLASFFGHLEVVRFLIRAGANVNSPSHNAQRVMPLHSAAAGRHLEIARVLLENGAEVNARQADDFIPIHAAAQNGQAEMIQLLLSYGADPKRCSRDGRNALDFAEEAGAKDAADLLR